MKPKQKEIYAISRTYEDRSVSFWTKNGWKQDDINYERLLYTKNDCYHKVKELRKGLSREQQKRINVF